MRATPSSARRGTGMRREEETLSGTGERLGQRGDLALVLDAGDEDPVGAGVDVVRGALEGRVDAAVAEPVGVDAGVDEDVVRPVTATSTCGVGGVGELVLEVDARDRAEPGDVGRDLGGVVREAVLDVHRDGHGQVRRGGARGRSSPPRSPPRRRAAPSAAATPRLVVPIAGNPASASAAADAWSHAFGSTSGSPGLCRSANAVISRPSTSARACASPGQRRGPAPNGQSERSTRTISPSGPTRRVTGTGTLPPGRARPSPRRPARGSRPARRRAPRRRRAAAGGAARARRRRPGASVRLVGGGDRRASRRRRGEVARRGAREHRDGQIRASVGAVRAGRRSATRRARAPRFRAARAGSISASSASTSARRRACVSPLAKRETVARSHAIVPYGPGGPGIGDGGGEQHGADDRGTTFRCPPKRRGPSLHDMTEIADVAAALADRTRARMLEELLGGPPLSAGALAVRVGVAPSTVSGHLRKLERAGLITIAANGRRREASLAGPHVAEALEALANIGPHRRRPPDRPDRGQPQAGAARGALVLRPPRGPGGRRARRPARRPRRARPTRRRVRARRPAATTRPLRLRPRGDQHPPPAGARLRRLDRAPPACRGSARPGAARRAAATKALQRRPDGRALNITRDFLSDDRRSAAA